MPIIWIPSSVFFKFLTRRLVELENVQLHLARNRPTNYGTMSSVVVYLMRHIMVTPQVKHTFLRDALRDLRLDSVMERFGIFFLHDLKLRNEVLCLRELPTEDSAEVIHLYGASLKKPTKTIADRPHQLVRVPQQGYPWGADPSWPRIQQLLETEPLDFLGKWKLDDNWTRPEQFQVMELFIEFTTQIWLSIAESFAPIGTLPTPATLDDAMETWTVSEIHSILGSDYCRFLPSSNGLQGKLPPNQKQQPSFSQRRTIFFPPSTDDIPENSIWHPYTQSPRYIFHYHQHLNNWKDDQEAIDQLHKGLDDIFGQLQCLPLSVLDNNKKLIWCATSGKINFISNSKFYRIQSVGSGAGQPRSQVPKRPQASKGVLQKRLIERLGGQIQKQARNKTRRKSAKTLRKRKPPTRKEKGKQPTAKASTQKKDPLVFQRVTRSKARLAREEGQESTDSGLTSGSENEKDREDYTSNEHESSNSDVESSSEW
jgi:hypothetical protein